MTDSMKFGPEWLRNMSADTSYSNTLNSANNSVGSGGNAGGNASMHTATTGGNSPQNSATRSVLPEFRYGREEMLALFDKDSPVPEILPAYKKIYIEKVQFPLALTPSTDEETSTTPTSILNSQRIAWLQRSPLGFNSSSGSMRVNNRVIGVTDRTRLRGKSTFHPIYHRPTALFENDMRPVLKPERSWPERNGTTNDTQSGSGSIISNSANLNSTDWNSSPTTSPRKEYSNHSRNIENWRKNRPNDEGAGGDATGSNIRLTNNSRWGRSTSWRDDDLTALNAASSDAPVNSCLGGANTIQRSYSTIATAETTDRSNLKSSSILNSAGTSGVGSSAQIPRSFGSSAVRNSQWVNSNNSGDSNTTDIEDNLPEWAMENPTEIGGTFDSSGAFHGSSSMHEENKNKSTTERKEDVESIPQQHRQSDANKISISTESNSNYKKKQSDANENVEIEEKETVGVITTADGSKAGTTVINELIHLPDRMQAVADDMVEKLIMDDDINIVQRPASCLGVAAAELIASNSRDTMSESFVTAAPYQQMNHTTATATPTIAPISVPISMSNSVPQHKPIPLFGGGIALNRETLHQLQSQQSSSSQQQLPCSSNSLSSVGSIIGTKDLWFYRDPQTKVQGPFSAIEMSEWYRAGYFNENLLVRRACDLRFRTLGELIKLCQNNMPFTHSFMIPVSLDNLDISAGSSQPSPKLVPLPPHLLNNFDMKQLPSNDELKGHVTAAANSVGAAVKSMLTPQDDVSHMLNMHFQLLQNKYMQQQEIMIFKELAKNEYFRQLSNAEQESVVRQKLQLLCLPEYLTSLEGLSQSLATLNPAVGNQLQNTLIECSKKVSNFPMASEFMPQPQQPLQPTVQQTHLLKNSNTGVPFGFLSSPLGNARSSESANNCVNSIKPIIQNENVAAADLLSLQGFMNNNNVHALSTTPKLVPNVDMGEILKHQQRQQQQLQHQQENINLLPTSNTHNSMIQMWLTNEIGSNETCNAMGMQASAQEILSKQNNQQWNTTSASETLNDNTLANSVNCNDGQDPKSSHEAKSTWSDSSNKKEEMRDDKTAQQETSVVVPANSEPLQAKQQKKSSEEANTRNAAKTVRSGLSKSTVKAEISTENKLSGNKRNKSTLLAAVESTAASASATASVKSKEDNNKAQKSEDVKKREAAEEKRRLKEERKRQQAEDEKRRLALLEDEKKRQLLQEQERMKQIQAQRRKALMENAPDASASAVSSSSAIDTKASNSGAGAFYMKNSKIQSSIAPWSLSSHNSNSAAGANVTNTALSLVEIQKAERRERRADQIRQLESLEKQTRANVSAVAAATAANDAESTLGWNAAPVPVKSFAEIQEEAKRLEQQQQMQKRKLEQDQQLQQQVNTAVLASNNLNASAGGNNSANIWSNNKIWAAAAATSNSVGFWEDAASKLNTQPHAVNAMLNTNTSGPSLLSTATAKQSNQVNVRSLRKSQTVSVMENPNKDKAVSKSSSINSVQMHKSKPQQQTAQLKNKDNNEKKASTVGTTVSSSATGCKSRTVNTASSSSHKSSEKTAVAANAVIKSEDYESEFTAWCVKILSGITTKVDVPTFVAFLQDLESPFEVKDYVRMYLGENKEFTDFAKHFLERRSKMKSLQRAQNAHNDDMCKPAPAITPSSSNDHSDNKGKQKRIKKNKMTKLDARILGFSVTAAEGRINVGDRDYVDNP